MSKRCQSGFLDKVSFPFMWSFFVSITKGLQIPVIKSIVICRFCAAVKREHYPEQMFTQEVPVLPGHVITLKPPVILHSLLPIDLNYYLKDTDIAGTVKPGKSASLHGVGTQMLCKLLVPSAAG